MASWQGKHNTPLHVLVAAVTAAERDEPMPSQAELAAQIGCVPHGVAMAMGRLERAGVLKRVGDAGKKRVLVVRTGAMTAEAGEAEG